MSSIFKNCQLTCLDELSIIKRGCTELLPEEDLLKKLVFSRQSGKLLRVKLGLDPTAQDIHLGHVVVLRKLRQFQELGHVVIFLIGDFTAMIGDPTGRNEMRPILSKDEIIYNAQTYFDQALKVLIHDKTELRYNSEWFEKLNISEFIKLTSCSTVARMLERDDFSQRYINGLPIGIHEFLYPLLQGYDSVALSADIELGGNDQKFNLLMGRALQKFYSKQEQCILTMPLLRGLDGVEKMSKSKKNAIGINEKPNEMFGKLMSISDDLMWEYYLLLSEKDQDQIDLYRHSVQNGENPRHLKVLLAKELVKCFHSPVDAERAAEDFEYRVRGGVPINLPMMQMIGAPMIIGHFMKKTGLVTSTSEANRNIEQGGVKINGDLVQDKAMKLLRGEYLLQIGKRRFARVQLD